MTEQMLMTAAATSSATRSAIFAASGWSSTRFAGTFGGTPARSRMYGEPDLLLEVLLVRRRRDVHAPQQHVADLAGRVVEAAVRPAGDEQARADAGAEREEHEVLRALRVPLPLLADGGRERVVLDRGRSAERLLDLSRNGASTQPSFIAVSTRPVGSICPGTATPSARTLRRERPSRSSSASRAL